MNNLTMADLTDDERRFLEMVQSLNDAQKRVLNGFMLANINGLTTGIGNPWTLANRIAIAGYRRG